MIRPKSMLGKKYKLYKYIFIYICIMGIPFTKEQNTNNTGCFKKFDII